jgi:NADPH:quinone reductase-like Zn-dependent oxidoreductase
MRAVVVRAYDRALKGVGMEILPTPQPGPGEVLVQMRAAPINPSDVLFTQGLYGFIKPTPVVAGFEGCGVVVGAGAGLLPRWWLGRRVTVAVQDSGDGTWAEYVRVPALRALPVPNALSDEQAAMLLVNPMSAYAMLDLARRAGATAILHTAAGSALGRMLWRLGQRRGIEVVGIVRRQALQTELQAMGMRHVLDSSAPDFPATLQALCQQHRIRLAYDAVGGELTAQLAAALLPGGVVKVYGALALQAAQVSPHDLLFRQIRVEGFWLTRWIEEQCLPRALLGLRDVSQLAAGDLSSVVRARYPYERAQAALQDYTAQMSGGKILLVP